LATFSVRDIWLDAQSGLPLKIAYEQRDAQGAADRILFEVTYSDYRSVGGNVFPFRMEKAINGTTWATITILTVAVDTGLSDSQFVIQ
jgi:hypothetical protein